VVNPASRLARLLSWYEKQYQLEQNRLHLCMDQFLRAGRDLDQHREQVLARRNELVQAETVEAFELAALASFRHRAEQREAELVKMRAQREQAVIRQRAISQKAQTRLRLMEKLHDRRLAEFTYQTERELETMASEMHLAGVVRSMNNVMSSPD
jgi:hypothetical protein